MKKVVLGEVCDFFNGGAWSDKEYVNEGIPVLKVTNCKSTGFQLDNLNYLSEKSREKYKKNNLIIGDIIVATVGSHPNLIESAAGRSCIVNSQVEGFYLNQNAVCIRTKDKRILSQKYLGYLCKCADFQHYIQSRGRGAANQMRIAISSIKEYSFTLPDFENQQYIADILSAYDDLIENNQKQIKLLEEAAQRLYKEWFVDLRFPGHENTKIVDGVPEGWSKNPIQDFISYEIGGGWGEELQNEKSMIPAYVIRGTDIKGLVNGQLQSVPYRYHTAGSLETRKLLDGDIVFEVSGGSKTEGVARTVRIIDLMLKTWDNSVICASFCKRIKPIPSFSQYLYDSFRWMRLNGKTQEYDKKSASSIVNYRWKDFLAQEKILKPDEETISQYNNIAGTIYTKIIVCSCQIEQAKMKRDLLLPKLMSGELEV